MCELVITIKDAFRKKFQQGYPLIFEEAIRDPHDLGKEGSLLKLVGENGAFIGKGFYGKQNKGLGWVLTHKEKETIDQQFFERKISAALNDRKPFFDDEDTTAFRVFNGEGDGIGGFTIDYYKDNYVINWYSDGIFQFKEEVTQSLEKLVSYKGIYEKKRFNVGGKYVEDDDFVMGEREEFPIIVKENGVRFAVYLNDGPMTGIFLDQREVRKTIRKSYAKGKKVLNTFSYTGAFSVCAALGGAAHTTSVDLANRSLPRTTEQFSMNNIEREAHEIKVMDVFRYFKYAVKKGISYEMIILDPPSFARSKKNTFSVPKDYKNLLKDAIAITKRNGVIVASTNYAGFGMTKFKELVKKAFHETGKQYRVIEEFSLPEDFKTNKDFPEGDYLKVLFIKKMN
ncbi:class I SAM-dependent rRNA methyltransferase [Bacillus piscicola]|uniref:class I SAM-dependent rRNA methyltransferase n=1 Tax=Bacillus piscicola TaxID=1632684 RepID=UPI001F08F8C8|nr:class I SAM-dependent rRNA methyltransferase [Bacillus piscicola]